MPLGLRVNYDEPCLLAWLWMELDERGDVALRCSCPTDSPHAASGNGGDRGETAVTAARRIRDRDERKHTVDSLQYERIMQVGCGIDGPADNPSRSIVGDGDGEGIVFTGAEGRG